ncbi:uncharacterized protein TNCV_449081 [Trichonephila clavipes]|nr:uncharacterized protein TNCV_449081 [Trichonephila clavipes]
MDVCNCTVPARHGGTLNSCGAAYPLMKLVEEEERCEANDYPQGVISLNWGETEQNRTVIKAKDNDRLKNIALHRDESRGP